MARHPELMAINNYMWFNATVADVETALIPQKVQHIVMLTPILDNLSPYPSFPYIFSLLAHLSSVLIILMLYINMYKPNNVCNLSNISNPISQLNINYTFNTQSQPQDYNISHVVT